MIQQEKKERLSWVSLDSFSFAIFFRLLHFNYSEFQQAANPSNTVTVINPNAGAIVNPNAGIVVDTITGDCC
jgi:hypothetical protein